MTLNVDHLTRTIDTLERALEALKRPDLDGIEYDLFRNAAIKSFELSLETTGKLLRRALKAYTGNPDSVDRLVFNEVLRQAGKHGLLNVDEVERWLAYRTNRNTTAHDYGEGFANETLSLLPRFITDARQLVLQLQERFHAADD
jgi:nucleotidyltransferase substrate binding protein (TIGR01987 family)